MRMTGEARPLETEEAERSELSASAIPVEDSKEEEETLMLSTAFTEVVVVGKVKAFQLRKGLWRWNWDMGGDAKFGTFEGVQKDSAADLGASG